jgi:hypothetical protein
MNLSCDVIVIHLSGQQLNALVSIYVQALISLWDDAQEQLFSGPHWGSVFVI